MHKSSVLHERATASFMCTSVLYGQGLECTFASDTQNVVHRYIVVLNDENNFKKTKRTMIPPSSMKVSQPMPWGRVPTMCGASWKF